MNQKIELIIVIFIIIGLNMNLYKLYSKGLKRKGLFNKKGNKNNDKKYFKVKDENGIEHELFGEKERFGFTNIEPNEIKANMFFKTNILIWGSDEKVVGKNLKVIGLDSLGKKCELSNINVAKKSRKYKLIPCTAVEELSLYFTEADVWKIYIYIDHELYGETSLKVKNF